MTTGTVAVTAAPVQQGRTQQLWDSVRITDQSGRVIAEERSGCKTSSHDNETENAAARSVFGQPVEPAKIIAEFLTER